jgi:AAA domain/Bifunctional DNA primase/polymerase, N-terminal
MTPTECRLHLLDAGFHPIPLRGKHPGMTKDWAWQNLGDADREQIATWGKMFGDAVNTGILTKYTPALDIDILHPEAAEAAEALVTERFEERGHVLTRTGQAPKRAIFFRTDKPFRKINRSLVAPDGSEQKIELLADGQQVVVAGIHPNTHKAYTWHGGELGQITAEELPDISEAEAKQLVDDVATLLVEQFGFKEKTKPKTKGNGAEATHGGNWGYYLDNLISHDALRDYANALLAAGMAPGAVVNHLREQVERLQVDDVDRKNRRLHEIPAMVSSGAEKIGNDKPASTATSATALIQTSAQFVADFVPPDYLVDTVLQRRFFYSLTGKTGSGKTALVLLIAASVALGRPIGKYDVVQGRVLYFAGENPDDVRMRWIAMARPMGFDLDTINVCFIPGRFKISDMRARILKEIQELGEVALVIIDTSAAYFEGDEPNNNAQQVQHALRLRGLVALPGGPCVLANSHPVKNAAADNLIPYGGGAFINEVDGNLTCSKDDMVVELHWQGKFRGTDFPPISFLLKPATDDRLKDSKFNPIWTVIAEFLSETEQQQIADTARSNEQKLLAELDRDNTRSWAELARALGWSLKTGEPHKTLVKRTLDRLKAEKLITIERGRAVLSAKGKKAVKPDEAAKEKTRPDPSLPFAEPGKPKLRVVGTVPPGTSCIACFEADAGVRSMTNGQPGEKAQPLHAKCAPGFFQTLKQK